jgi:hypothetical protein
VDVTRFQHPGYFAAVQGVCGGAVVALALALVGRATAQVITGACVSAGFIFLTWTLLGPRLFGPRDPSNSRRVGPVKLTVVGNEMEAEMVCGLLRTNGIKCWHQKTDMAAAVGQGRVSMIGPTTIFIRESDYEAARELLSQKASG